MNLKKSTKESQFKSTYLMSSFIDYFEILKDISFAEQNKLLWYRGQFNEAWHLEPNLFRHSKETADYWGRTVDPLNSKFHFSSGYTVQFPNFVDELNSFKQLVLKENADNIYIPKNDFEWMFLGQHYGLLTPLVDFTTDPLVALFFSCDGKMTENEFQNLDSCNEQFSANGYSDDCAAVFVMLPSEINRLSFFRERDNDNYVDIVEPVELNDSNVKKLEGYVTWNNACFTPLCIVAPKTDYRLIRQSGNFRREFVIADFQPQRNRSALCFFQNTNSLFTAFEQDTASAIFAQSDFIANRNTIRRNIHFLAVYCEMAMCDQFSGFTSGRSQAHTECNVIQSGFQNGN